jgi:hypothetical protein
MKPGLLLRRASLGSAAALAVIGVNMATVPRGNAAPLPQGHDTYSLMHPSSRVKRPTRGGPVPQPRQPREPIVTFQPGQGKGLRITINEPPVPSPQPTPRRP